MRYADNVISFEAWWSTLDSPLWAMFDLNGEQVTPWLSQDETHTVPSGQFMAASLGVRANDLPDRMFKQDPRLFHAGHVVSLNLATD